MPPLSPAENTLICIGFSDSCAFSISKTVGIQTLLNLLSFGARENSCSRRDRCSALKAPLTFIFTRLALRRPFWSPVRARFAIVSRSKARGAIRPVCDVIRASRRLCSLPDGRHIRATALQQRAGRLAFSARSCAAANLASARVERRAA